MGKSIHSWSGDEQAPHSFFVEEVPHQFMLDCVYKGPSGQVDRRIEFGQNDVWENMLAEIRVSMEAEYRELFNLPPA
jgi:hypothetical protein